MKMPKLAKRGLMLTTTIGLVVSIASFGHCFATAFAWTAATGPRGGAAAVGPRGAAATGPRGGAAAVGPRGAAATGPRGGTVAAGPGGRAAVARPGYPPAPMPAYPAYRPRPGVGVPAPVPVYPGYTRAGPVGGSRSRGSCRGRRSRRRCLGLSTSVDDGCCHQPIGPTFHHGGDIGGGARRLRCHVCYGAATYYQCVGQPSLSRPAYAGLLRDVCCVRPSHEKQDCSGPVSHFDQRHVAVVFECIIPESN